VDWPVDRAYAQTARLEFNGLRCRELTWFNEVCLYWRDFFDADNLTDGQADLLAAHLVGSPSPAAIPQIADRVLVARAITYRCDAFQFISLSAKSFST
jgi:hypothetical protein